MTTRLRTGLAILVALLLAALVAGVVLYRQNDDLTRTQELASAERTATKEASRIAVAMTSYDYRTVDKDFAWIDQDGTAQFQDTFSESTKPIRQLITRTRATATGKVSDAAGTAEDADHVEVLLFVDQVLKRAGDRKSSVDSNRVVMEMVHQRGRWLVDDVELR
jgi:Mce-associated membrane protein